MSEKVKDKRERKMYIGPAPSWIPDGVENTVLNVYNLSGKIIGDLELGSDGFVQGVVKLPVSAIMKRVVGNLETPITLRIERHPSQDKVILRVLA